MVGIEALPAARPSRRFAAYMLSCADRNETRRRTLASFAATDWEADAHVVLDTTTFERRQERQEHTARRLLELAVDDGAELVLFLEDDLEFNRHLRHNLERWTPLAAVGANDHFFGSLYNPSILSQWRDPEQSFFVADPDSVYGSQALILGPATVRHAVAHWHEVPGMQDIKLSRLAAPLCRLYYHIPSLVQHLGTASAWGGPFHSAHDYDPLWRA